MKRLKPLLIIFFVFVIAFSGSAVTPAEKRAELEKKT